jgi:hypothetical protein
LLLATVRCTGKDRCRTEYGAKPRALDGAVGLGLKLEITTTQDLHKIISTFWAQIDPNQQYNTDKFTLR